MSELNKIIHAEAKEPQRASDDAKRQDSDEPDDDEEDEGEG
ncbi:MAG: hypothetical protein V6Z86_07810 [Hyphomicrobiales bacterium]